MLEFRIDEVPTGPAWRLTPLYKADAQGKLRSWSISFDGARLSVEHGLADGEKIVDAVDVDVRGNNSLEEQALIRARARYLEMFRDKAYRPAGQQVDLKEPMTAMTWIDKATMAQAKAAQKAENALAKKEGRKPNKLVNAKWRVIDKYPVWVLEKLDGHRLLADLEGLEVRLRSRLNNVLPHLPHIRACLQTFFSYLPAGAIVDGEAYTHELTFQQFTSAIKRQKQPYDPNMQLIRYYVFDLVLPDDMPYDARYTILVNAYNRYLEETGLSVEQCTFQPLRVHEASSDAGVMALHDSFVAAGYEGAIVRKVGLPGLSEKELAETYYSNRRCSGMLKYKKFDDEEGTIVDVLDASGREEGCAIFRVRNKAGKEFDARPRGSFALRRKWLEDRKKLLGLPLTYRFQGLSDEGIPRFAIAIAVRDYE